MQLGFSFLPVTLQSDSPATSCTDQPATG